METWGHGRSLGEVCVGDGAVAPRQVGGDLERRGVLRIARGDPRLAEMALTLAVSYAREAGDWKLAVRATARLVALARGERRWPRAEALVRELVGLAAASGSREALGIALRLRGQLLSDPRYLDDTHATRPPVDASEAFEASIAALDGAADPVEQLISIRALAACLLSQGRTADALDWVRRAKRTLAH